MTKTAWLKALVASVACGVLATGCKSDDVEGDDLGEGGGISTDGGPLTERTSLDDRGERVAETFESVLFDYNSYQIKAGETAKLEAVAEFMKSRSGVTLVAEGHCDERGTREYNEVLGERRAVTVRAYLVGLGIGGDRVETMSYGEDKPLDPGHTEEAWKANRRVEFSLYEKK